MSAWRSNAGLAWFRRVGLALVSGLILAVIAFGQSTDKQTSPQSQSDESSKSDKANKSDKSDDSSNPGKRDKDSEPATTRLRLEVTDPKGRPVGNASVYIRFNQPGGILHKDKLAELNLKTNEDGTVKVPEIPQGQILIQVIAKGWHTYGKWYTIEKDRETLQIKLEAPPRWY